MGEKDWKYKKKNKTDIDRYFSNLKSFLNDILQQAKDHNEMVSSLDQVSNNPQFEELAKLAAQRIVKYQANTNAKTWREAARRSTHGRKVYQLLRQELQQRQPFQDLITESAGYIKTLPYNISTRIVKKVADLTLEGKRHDDIAIEIKKYFPEATRASATLIARTQVSKTYSAITQARAQSVGVHCYVWRTVGGPLVRDSHRHMDDVIVFYQDPPSPEMLIGRKSQGNYHAGNIYNCRCYQEPLLDVDDVSWPHKVYRKGKITRLQRNSFTKLA